MQIFDPIQKESKNTHKKTHLKDTGQLQKIQSLSNFWSNQIIQVIMEPAQCDMLYYLIMRI